MNLEKIKWMKISLFIGSLLLLVSGFTFGYLYNYKSNNECTANPFIYGVQEMNALNEASFICTCSGGNGLHFYFDEYELNEGNYFFGENSSIRNFKW